MSIGEYEEPDYESDLKKKILSMPKDTESLKPCPFCGSQKVWLTDWANPAIQCRNCHLVVNTESLMDEEELVERWNRRANE